MANPNPTPQKSVKNCGNCKWSIWQENSRGKRLKETAGDCGYSVPWPAMPSAQAPIQDRKNGIWPDGGTTCPCFEPRLKNPPDDTGAKPAAVG